MTVAELIAALQQVEDKTRPVKLEGCDCINPAKGVDPDDLAPSVLITAVL